MSFRNNKDCREVINSHKFVEQILVGGVDPGVNPPLIPTPIMGANSFPTPTNPITVGRIKLKRIRSNDRIELIVSVNWGFIASVTVENSSLALINFDQTVLLSIIRNDGKVIYQIVDTAGTILTVSPSTSETLTSSQIFRTTTFKCNDSDIITFNRKATYTLTIQALTPAVTLTPSTDTGPIVDFLRTTFSVFAFNFDGKSYR